MRHGTLSCLVLAVTVLACSGEDGRDGAAGMQGPPGTANVISGRDTVSNADWSTTTTQLVLSTGVGSASGGKPARFLDFNVAALTPEVHERGAVLVWMQVNPHGPIQSQQAFMQLPYTFIFLSSNNLFHYFLEITPGRIRTLFLVQDINDPSVFGDPLTPVQATRIYRWVIVPPAAASVLASLRMEDGPDAALEMLERRGFNVVSK